MQYCEQMIAVSGFEPWNAVSNAAFLLAALAAVWTVRRRGDTPAPGPVVLIGLAAAIGAGSFAWHATHAAWAELADVLPILAFVLLFLFLAVRRLHGTLAAGCACAAMAGAIVGTGVALPHALNGSAAYLPVWLGLVWLGLRLPGRVEQRALRAAALLFAFSLVARTLDLRACETFVHGSHWLWHVCNGGVIHLALRAALAPAGR
ncbi:MAG: ceramidase domain-containing protein [Gammaproteobacteria bacterium]